MTKLKQVDGQVAIKVVCLIAKLEEKGFVMTKMWLKTRQIVLLKVGFIRLIDVSTFKQHILIPYN